MVQLVRKRVLHWVESGRERERERALAFEGLYERYVSQVYAYVRYRVDSAAEAEDLTAAIFERVLAKIETFRSDEPHFAAWLWRIARNAVIDHYRKQRLRQHLPLEEIASPASEEPLPEEWVLREERVQEIRVHLKTLPEREQEIIALKFGFGLTNRRIAEVLRMKESTVGSALHRAMIKLRRRMEEEKK
jgi:RNA polymerase sigma factor (sigma-70 family)